MPYGPESPLPGDESADLLQYQQSLFRRFNALLHRSYNERDGRIHAITTKARHYIEHQLYDEQSNIRAVRLPYLEKLIAKAEMDVREYEGQTQVKTQYEFDDESGYRFQTLRESPLQFTTNVTQWGAQSAYGEHTGIVYPRCFRVRTDATLEETIPRSYHELGKTVMRGSVMDIPATIAIDWYYHWNGDAGWLTFHFNEARDADAFAEHLTKIARSSREAQALREAEEFAHRQGTPTIADARETAPSDPQPTGFFGLLRQLRSLWRR